MDENKRVAVCGSTRHHLPLIHHCRTLMQLEPHFHLSIWLNCLLLDSSSTVDEKFQRVPSPWKGDLSPFNRALSWTSVCNLCRGWGGHPTIHIHFDSSEQLCGCSCQKHTSAYNCELSMDPAFHSLKGRDMKNKERIFESNHPTLN